MKVISRLEKAERESGINKPCEVCELDKDNARRVHGLTVKYGHTMPEPQPHEIMESQCYWCWRTHTTSLVLMNDAERAAYLRYFAVGDAGLWCAPEHSTLKAEMSAACNNSERRFFGEHFDELKAILEDHRRDLELIAARRLPIIHYLCRVDGCECDYPKTEEDWQNIASDLAKRAA